MSRFAWALPFFVLSTIAAFALNSLGRPLGYTLFRDVFPYFAMFLGIGAWSLGEFSLQRVCTGAAFGLVACGISSALITLCAVPAGNGKFLGEVGTGQLLRFSLPTAVSAMASLLYLQSDRVMLGLLSSESDVGVYSVAASIATQLLVLPGAVAIVLAPKFALHNVERNDNEGHATYSLAMGWVIFLMVVAGCLLALLSRPLLQLCGEEYVRGSAALALLSIGTMLGGGVSSIAGYSLSISGRPNVALGISLLAAGTNMAVNAVLIPRWGLEGAAVGTSVGLLLAAGLSSAALFRHTGFRGMAPSRRPFLWISLLIASVALTSSMIGSQYLGAGMVAALGLTGIWVFWRSSPGGNIQGRNE